MNCTSCQPGRTVNKDSSACVVHDVHCSAYFFHDVHESDCTWVHVPIVVVGVAVMLVFCCFAIRLRRVVTERKKRSLDEAAPQTLKRLETALWKGDLTGVADQQGALKTLGWSRAAVEEKTANIRANHSEVAGVSMLFLLSDQFTELSECWTRRVDPTFDDMKEAFWGGTKKLGDDIICPRDRKMGCALVDWLPRDHRRPQTHFLSWTWQYSLTQLQSALRMWGTLCPELVFFYMCFFVNNQFRIIVEKAEVGSDRLEEVFRSNLLRIGRVVAVLDTWDAPVYLTRVWTIYEQFTACSLQVPVQFILPESAAASLQSHIFQGEFGISKVKKSLCNVDSERSEAWCNRDEEKVKRMIRDDVGFQEVNNHVKRAMVSWISEVVHEKMLALVLTDSPV